MREAGYDQKVPIRTQCQCLGPQSRELYLLAGRGDDLVDRENCLIVLFDAYSYW